MNDGRRGWALARVGGAILLLACCRGAERQEVRALRMVVERFQRAGLGERPSLAPAVQGLRCETDAVRGACSVCATATDQVARALVLQAAAKATFDAFQQGRLSREQVEAEGLEARVSEAQRLLDAGRNGMDHCHQALEGLRKRFGE